MSLVLFDLDGTLVDSGPGIRASVRHAAAAVGIAEPTDDQLRALIGPPFPAAFLDVLGVDEATADAMMADYRDTYGSGGMFDASVYPGIPELLAELTARGDVLAVATSKPADYAREIVAHLGLAEHVAGGVHGTTFDGSVQGKAAVVGLALAANGSALAANGSALAANGSAPAADGSARPHRGALALVGDRHHDVEGARVHGVPCIGVDWGFGGRDELEAAGAVTVVDKPGEVVAALDEL